MTNRQLKKRIREAFSHGTPDISQKILMDALLSDRQDQKGVECSMEEQRAPSRFPVFSVAAAACAAIAVLAISINLITNRPNSGSTALVTIEEALAAVHAYPFDKPDLAVEPNVDWELDADDQSPHYDISLNYGSIAYDFVVDAKTGKVLTVNQDSNVSNNYITREAAKRIALHVAELDESQISNYSCEDDLDDDTPHFNISFRSLSSLYHFEIAIRGGAILDQYILQAVDHITEEAAKAIALESAQQTDGQISNYSVKFDGDELPAHYDIAFIGQAVIYEFEIHAVTGEILSTEKHPMVEDFISLDDALSLLNKRLDIYPVPVPTSFQWSFQDYYGRMCYDISTEYADGTTIKTKIDAATGHISLWISTGPVANPIPNVPDGKLSADQATSIALNQVGLHSLEAVTDFELEEDLDDNPPHYDVSFRLQWKEYSFEIGMYDGGQILDSKEEQLFGSTPD